MVTALRMSVILTLTLAACGEERPPAPTAEENERLDEAEAMLNEMGNEEGPADAAADPSSSSD